MTLPFLMRPDPGTELLDLTATIVGLYVLFMAGHVLLEDLSLAGCRVFSARSRLLNRGGDDDN